MISVTKKLVVFSVLTHTLMLAGCGGAVDSTNQPGPSNSSSSSSSSGSVVVDPPAASPKTLPDVASPLRRLTHSEYDNTVRDLLGSDGQSDNFPLEAVLSNLKDDATLQAVGSLLAEEYMNAAVRVANASVANQQAAANLNGLPKLWQRLYAQLHKQIWLKSLSSTIV